MVQVNGKLKFKLSSCENLSKEEILNLAKNNSKVKEILKNKELVKTIFVPSKLVNINANLKKPILLLNENSVGFCLFIY